MTTALDKHTDDQLRDRLRLDGGDQDALDALHARHPVLSAYWHALDAAFRAEQASKPFDPRVLAHPDGPAVAALRGLYHEALERWIAATWTES